MRIFLGFIAALLLAAPAWGQTVPSYNQVPTCTVATLAACGATSTSNAIVRFTDSNTDIVGVVVAGGGTDQVIAYCEAGTCWVLANDSGQTTGAVAKKSVVSLASGALTLNTVHLATASADYDIPDGACNAAADVGNWVTVVLEDASTVISITSDDASNVIYVPGLGLGAGDELDSVSTAAHEGQSITLTCLAAEGWYMTAGNLNIGGGAAIAWADGGVAD